METSQRSSGPASWWSTTSRASPIWSAWPCGTRASKREVAHNGVHAIGKAQSFRPDADRARHHAARHRRLRGGRAACGRPARASRSSSSPPGTPSRTRSRGLTVGGDDYVTKPFSLEEVVARLRAILRRSEGRSQRASTSVLAVGDLDPRRGHATRSCATGVPWS